MYWENWAPPRQHSEKKIYLRIRISVRRVQLNAGWKHQEKCLENLTDLGTLWQDESERIENLKLFFSLFKLFQQKFSTHGAVDHHPVLPPIAADDYFLKSKIHSSNYFPLRFSVFVFFVFSLLVIFIVFPKLFLWGCFTLWASQTDLLSSFSFGFPLKKMIGCSVLPVICLHSTTS